MTHYGHSLSRELKKDLFLSERQLAVADLYFSKRKTQAEIAAELNVSQATIHHDIKKIMYEYHMKRMNKLQVYINIMDQQLSAVEKAAWEGWERSIGESHRKVTKKDASNAVIEQIITEDKLIGDPRFLTTILSAQDRRIRILGLDQPKEIIMNTMEGRLTRLILEEKVTFDMLVNEVGQKQAVRYFNLAGVEVPDIVEGEFEYDDYDDVLDVLNYDEEEE